MINIPLDDIKEKILDQTELSEEDLNEKIKIKLDQLSGLISEEGAAHIVANEHDVNLTDEEDSITIDGLVSGMKGINVPGRVVRKYELRTFENDRGKGQYAKFLLGDDSGITMVVMWGDTATNISKFEEGDVLLLKDVMVKDGRKGTEIHAGDRSEVEINPEGVEVKQSQNTAPQTQKKKVKDINEEDERVEIFSTIVQIFEPKYFERDPQSRRKLKKDEEGNWVNQDGKVIEEPDIGAVLNIYADDGTDSIRVVLWKDRILEFLDTDEAQLLSFRDNLQDFEGVKNELLGEMMKIKGRVQRNSVTDKLELVATNVQPNVDPSEELVPEEDEAQNKDEEPGKKNQEKTQEREPAEESATESEDKEKEEVADEDEELESLDEEDVLSLEDIEDIEDEL